MMNGRMNVYAPELDETPPPHEPSMADRASARVASRGTWAAPASVVPDTDAPLHVAPCDDGWQLVFEGIDTPAGVFPTKKRAMAAARELIAERGNRLVEHGADGRIR
jgi:hypothetical protein